MAKNVPMPVIEGDVAFVTGAASGFGLALSKELVSRGASVILVDINEEGCRKVATEMNEKAGKTVAIAAKADVTRFEEQVAAYELGKETFRRVDYFFANAGIVEHPWLPLFNPSTASSRPITKPDMTTMQVNLNGELNTAALAFQVFERQDPHPRSGFRGKLVMTASVYGYWPCKSMPMYTTAKAGILNFMRGMAKYYEDKDITVNLISPNLTATSIIPPDIMASFNEDALCPIELVVEQMISVLGPSKDTGRAITVAGKLVWDQPMDTFMLDKNIDNLNAVENLVGKRLGLWE